LLTNEAGSAAGLSAAPWGEGSPLCSGRQEPGAGAGCRRIRIVAQHGVAPFDLSAAALIFGAACGSAGEILYETKICGDARVIRGMGFDICVPWGLDVLNEADTILLAGVDSYERHISEELLHRLRLAADRGARLASICYGAFVLAAAGLLDGRRASTHWLGTEALARRYPRVQVEPNALFVEDGPVITSSGPAAGLDMCLHMVRSDFGEAVAARAARIAIAPTARAGDQAPCARFEPPEAHASIAATLHWMSEHFAQPLSVRALAAQAKTSERTFTRRFREQTGTTPLRWLLEERIRRACELLESTPLAVEQIALTCGFDSAATLRARFQRYKKVSPSAYRRRYAQQREGAVAD
jgi:transcriptional regulator GlxA family with amidase domain